MVSLVERLEAVGLRWERYPLTDVDRSKPVQERLRATGVLYQLGQRCHFRSDEGRSWGLSPSWLSFLEGGGLRVFRDGGRHPLLTVLTPLQVVLQTQDLLEALDDHRDGKWPYQYPEYFGLDRCLVFATEEGWMNGWAFDTRIRKDRECCIRRITDFSADDSQMKAAWPEERTGDVTPFDTWLDERVSELESHPR